MTAAYQFPDPAERTPSILVVEFEVLIRLAIVQYLQECGFKVHGVRDAMEAIIALQSDIVTDLVLVDAKAPQEQDGFRLAQWIRANWPELALIIRPGETKTAEAARELCRNEPFLADPYDLQALVARIRRELDAKKSG